VRFGGKGGMGVAFIKLTVRVGSLTALNTGHARRSLRSLGLRHIFASAIATAKTSPAPGTLGAIQAPSSKKLIRKH